MFVRIGGKSYGKAEGFGVIGVIVGNGTTGYVLARLLQRGPDPFEIYNFSGQFALHLSRSRLWSRQITSTKY